MKVLKHITTDAVFEFYRRRLFKINTNDPAPYFTLIDIDIARLYALYPNHFPVSLRETLECVDIEKVLELDVKPSQTHLYSHIVSNHPDTEKFNDLASKLDDIQANTTDEAIIKEATKDYSIKVKSLGASITSKIKSEFRNAVLYNDKVNDRLESHIDTLLFACLYFYDLYWDNYGTSYNGRVADNNSISNLTHGEQPYHYRADTQSIFISNLLYQYHSKFENQALGNYKAPKEFSIVIGGQTLTTKDPILTQWVMNSLVESIKSNKLPAATDYYGDIITKLVISKSINKSYLTHMKQVANVRPETYINVKRREVRRYCLEIHKLFSFYFQKPTTTFTKEQLHIYNNILRAFKMDDFAVKKRKVETESRTIRKDGPENNLRSLLTQ